MALEIAANAPLAVQGAMWVINEAQRGDIELEYVATWNASYLVTQDLMAAVDGFMNKKTPEFTGR